LPQLMSGPVETVIRDWSAAAQAVEPGTPGDTIPAGF